MNAFVAQTDNMIKIKYLKIFLFFYFDVCLVFIWIILVMQPIK